MTKNELTARFGDNHRAFVNYVNSLTDKEFTCSSNGKWTPGQQLGHIWLCLKPIAQALSSRDFILQTFGNIDRPTWDYDRVIDNYKTALEKGGKAPDRFVPEPVEPGSRNQLSADLAAILQAIQQQLHTYTGEELDTLALPHPLLGKLTIRELIYLMTYHAAHHHEQTARNLEAST
jgi:hypothetical protein